MSDRRRFPDLDRAVAWVAAAALLPLALACNSAGTEPVGLPEPAGPVNLILFLGDGMDDQALTIARHYELGPDGKLTMEGMPQRAAATVVAQDEDDPSQVVYVGDSASGGTALATGARTSIARISTAAGTDEDLTTIVELAQRAGMRTGIVTTAALTDASPAAFGAHIRYRFCQGPADMKTTFPFGVEMPGCPDDEHTAGGPGSIAEQLSGSEIDVLLGGGRQYFDQHMNPEDEATPVVLDTAMANGYKLVTTPAELAAAAPDDKLLGIFAPDTLPVEWRGEGGRMAEFIEMAGENEIVEPEPFSCEPNPQFEGIPTIEEMTRKAIELLENENGFFLMVEGASIDKEGHFANPCGSIGETLAFDRAIAAALEFAESRPKTLIVVTADHGQTAQIIPYPSFFAAVREAMIPIPKGDGAPVILQPPAQHTPGRFARVITKAGLIMNVNYATNVGAAEIPMFPPLQEHTGVQVPVFAAGYRSDPVQGLIRQPEVFDIMVRAADLEP